MFERWFRRSPPPGAALDTKASRTGPLIAVSTQGRAVWTPRDYGALAREGYQRNPVVHRCVRLIAEAAASVPWIVSTGAGDDRREPTAHPVAALLARPNPRQAGRALMEAVYGHLLVAGNAYVEAVWVGGRLRELHALRPDRMRVVPGPEGWPEAWDYSVGGRTVRFKVKPDGMPPILHLANFNPLDDHYGFAAIEAAQTSLDLHNAGSAWAKALLDNSARPSGALVYAPRDGGNLSDEQYQRLKRELEDGYQGARNAGRPLLLEGGLDWKAMAYSPKDLEFIDAKREAAREIALAFGVPPMLLGLPGDNTYSNYAEANRAFWRLTVLPLVGRTAEAMAQWLAPGFGDDLRIDLDTDQVEALSVEREALWRRVASAPFLAESEQREAVGYVPQRPEA